MDTSGFNIQTVKSKRNVLKYISKEDVELITNVKSSLLHFNCRCYEWASGISKFIQHIHLLLNMDFVITI